MVTRGSLNMNLAILMEMRAWDLSSLGSVMFLIIYILTEGP